MTTFKAPAVLFSAAVLLGAAGGAMQRGGGPGSEPGLTIAHTAAGLFVLGLAATVLWLISRGSKTTRPASEVFDDMEAVPGDENAEAVGEGRAFITASDGHQILPMVGPYDSDAAAFDELPAVRELLDHDGNYQWAVQFVTDEHVVGLANDYVKQR
ncbi:hypothetical protein [Mycobacteroides abscessus]|uniref:hypothetical protein n=1 Tax=Mycobacteroides abscessus TaxID=36809 RepID=UPI0018966C15